MVTGPYDLDAGQAAELAAKRLRDMGARHKSASDNGEHRPWYRIENKADDNTVAQVDIYDEIDWLWGVTSRDFRNELKALPDSVSTIDLHINSPGGDVYEALAIMNTLRQHDAKVITTVDGYAASSAGFIAVGASDELIMAKNAELMAHLPWALMVGDAEDMRKMAEDLERIGKNIASIFADRAGGTVDEWMAVLTAETWWSAQEAVDAGIADRVLDPKSSGAKNLAARSVHPRDHFDLSIYSHAGRSHAPAPRIPQAHNETPQPVEAEVTNGKEPTVATLSESVLQKLGLDADADEAAIEAAIEAALASDDTSGSDGGTTTEAAEATPEQVAAVAAKLGLTVMDSAVAEQLQAQARDGAAARAQQIREQDDATIRDAIAKGKILPANKDEWRKNLESNREGITALLATMPENTALAVSEVGHGVDNEASTIDAGQASVFARVTGRNYTEGV